MGKVSIKISLKIILIVLFLMLLSFSCFYYFVIVNYPHDLKDVFSDKARSTASSLSAGIHRNEDLVSEETILLGIQKNMWLDADIVNIRFNLYKNDKLVTAFANNNIFVGASSDIINSEAFSQGEVKMKFFMTGKEEYLKTAAPIYISGQTIGTVEVDFTLENLNNRISESIKKLLLIFFVISVISFMVMYFLLRLIVVQPVSKIKEGITAVADDNLNHRINISASDELGLLAAAFNKMTDDLKKTREELWESNRNLEKKVDERTSELQEKMSELKRFNDLVIDREFKMVELKSRIKELESKKG
jgi:methyl-accepting chemotaxis protein